MNRPRRVERDAARKTLDRPSALAVLGLPEGWTPPPLDVLERDARVIATRTLGFGLELAAHAASGLQLSPIWDERDGSVQLRLAVVPRQLRTRYFEGDGAREALEDPELFRLVAEVAEWVASDPVGGAFALDDTHRVWFDAEGPTRTVALPYQPHLKLLSLLLADGVRKLAFGLDTLEWLATLGLPIEEMRDDGDPPADAIRASADEALAEMWAEEAAWTRAAFGR
jgi:hypothetical protein